MEVLRNRAAEALASESTATLSTNGPGGLQVGIFPCEAQGLTLYLLIPSASDVLFNLETENGVVVTARRWQIEGVAEIVPPAQSPDNLQLIHMAEAAGCVLLAATAHRIHLKWTDGWGYSETLDQY